MRLTAECLATYGTVCHLCRSGGDADTADHLVPRHLGGSDELANLRPAHQACNSARGSRTLGEWYAAHPLPRSVALPPSRRW